MSSAVQPAAQPATFRDLARAIAEKDLPAFGLALQEVDRATSSDAMSGQQIAEAILRDPGLTSRVLRAANCAHFGRSGSSRVVTVSRAVVVLGINEVRSLCISALTVEALAGGAQFSHRVQQALGRALHAAVQARDIALRERLDRASAERLFVEALLSSIGELAFWCFGGNFAVRLEGELKAGRPQQQAEKTVLGTSLWQFGRELLQAWELGAVLQDSKQVELARRVCAAAEPGWTTAPAQQAVQAVAQALGLSAPDALTALRHNAEQAAALALALGAPDAARCIPAPPPPGALADVEAPSAFPEPNLQQQLRMLTEMAGVAASRKDLPLLLETCLEGMHRAVGLDRCVFCLLNPARTEMVARMAVGPQADALRAHLRWSWTAEVEARLGQNVVAWHGASRPGPHFIQSLIDSLEYFIATFTVDHQVIGLFYADRRPSGRALGAEAFESFQAFVTQAQMVVRALPRGAEGG